MKTSRKLLIVISAAAAVLLLAQLQSVEAPQVTRSVTLSPVEQYRVIDTALIPARNPKDALAALETMLNELGAEGWRVRSGAGGYVILAR